MIGYYRKDVSVRSSIDELTDGERELNVRIGCSRGKSERRIHIRWIEQSDVLAC